VDVAYTGPLGQEPIAIELHNTLYAMAGNVVDGLAEAASVDAWLDGIAPRLPESRGGSRRRPSAEELVELRDAVREALHAVIGGTRCSPAALDVINAASARAPRSPTVVWRPDAGPVAGIDYHGAGGADVVVGAFAADAIDLLTGPRRDDLRACGAPGCVLMFLKDHPRRQWCCNSCGNRARQARHYQRTRRQGPA
jgi:predicted RNA-binding Zn ribbon-like protein